MITANTTRAISNETTIKAFAASLGFRLNDRWPGRDCHDLGNVRLCFDRDDECVDVYAFVGKPGGVLKYQIHLTLGMPIEVLKGTIKMVVEAELR